MTSFVNLAPGSSFAQLHLSAVRKSISYEDEKCLAATASHQGSQMVG